ncbi:unnamed protein product [Mytilus edulis]|uniref:Uncharacterized protein n=1 Tax=Mytilus edulis TaxID=6550 RepID=A0A8S3QQI8_MYTED|nr:unnamed protein product [Mytilus edulis]
MTLAGAKNFMVNPVAKLLKWTPLLNSESIKKELSKDELDMTIKAELFAHRRSGSVTEAKKHKIKERNAHTRSFISKESGGNLSEEEKQLLLNQYNIRVQLAKEQRDYYREQDKLSKQNYMDLPDALKQSGNSPQSVQTTVHRSWDYAQQVHFSHHAQQVGPIYFKTPRKSNVCLEGSGIFLFVLYYIKCMILKVRNSTMNK